MRVSVPLLLPNNQLEQSCFRLLLYGFSIAEPALEAFRTQSQVRPSDHLCVNVNRIKQHLISPPSPLEVPDYRLKLRHRQNNMSAMSRYLRGK
jgi:hypothetical protein